MQQSDLQGVVDEVAASVGLVAVAVRIAYVPMQFALLSCHLVLARQLRGVGQALPMTEAKRTESDLAARIKADSGVDVENYNLSLGSYEVRKILKDHGNENVEAPRGQRAIVADDFAHIVDIVQNPISISLSENTYMGKPAIVFSGRRLQSLSKS